MPRRIEDLEELQIYLNVDLPSSAEVLRRRNDYADTSARPETKQYLDHVDVCNEYLEVSAL